MFDQRRDDDDAATDGRLTARTSDAKPVQQVRQKFLDHRLSDWADL